LRTKKGRKAGRKLTREMVQKVAKRFSWQGGKKVEEKEVQGGQAQKGKKRTLKKFRESV